MTKSKFDHKKVEAKWQKRWEEESILAPEKMLPAGETFYNLWMFPYPSAEGLHAGHAFASTGSDVFGRYQRMNGKNVFQPIGYDSFGIHSENFAIKINQTPQEVIARTTKNYERQMRSLGHGYDWSRTVTTSDTDYYRWTQWLFIELFKAGLAYRKKAQVNWCPSCKTVLSDEQVMTPSQAGKTPKDAKGNEVADTGDLQVCERCGTVVEKKDLEQWFFRITDYAERLLNNLEKIDWSERVAIAQRNWIGKKQGIEITYDIEGTNEKVTVFTTAPVNFGATFLVVAPEHKLVESLLNGDFEVDEQVLNKVGEYVEVAKSKTKEERISEGANKTGEFTGLYAHNHVNGKNIPIWVTDFVLADVGTGAVQGCPGHDLRDFLFAKKFDLPIVRVVVGKDSYDGPIEKEEQVVEHGMDGIFVNSEFLNGMEFESGLQKTMDYFEEKGWGKRVSNYHLRDWLISRQRYWGPPIPMIYCEQCAGEGESWFSEEKIRSRGVARYAPTYENNENGELLHSDQSDWESKGWWPEENLPVQLPDIEDFKPKGDGRGPLADHPEFYETKCPHCGSEARRETDVSDTFLDSAWYFLRYPSVNIDNINRHSGLDPESGNLDKDKILNQVQDDGEIEQDDVGLPWDKEITKNWLPVDLYFGGAEHAVLHLMYARFVTQVLHDLGYLEFEEPFPKFFAHGLMIKDGAKMSKSRGNVVNPDEYIEKFGADTLRLYLMFMGPMDGYPDFRDTGIEGMRRFVDKLWNLFESCRGVARYAPTDGDHDLEVKMHETIRRVTEDVKVFKNNTAIAAIMEYVNMLREYNNPNNSDPDFHQDDRGAVRDGGGMRRYLEVLALLLNPFAPHLAEEAWELLGNEFSIQKAKWPEWDESKLVSDVVEIMVQVNGKLRGQISIESGEVSDQQFVVDKAKQDEQVAKWLEGKEIKKEIYIKGKILNFVV